MIETVVNLWRGLSSKERRFQLDDYFLVRYIYNSNRLENIPLDFHQTQELFESGKVRDYTGDVRDLLSVSNTRNTYNYVMQSLQKREPITIPFIKELHRKMMFASIDERRYSKGERAGEFKKGDYVIGPYDAGALPDEVTAEMDDYVAILSAFCKKDDLTKVLRMAAASHCVFENVHPFADGNGRTGRWLTNYWLMLNDFPPIIFSEEHRKSYYDALGQYDQNQDISLMCSYFECAIRCTWEERLQRGATDRGQLLRMFLPD